MLIPVVHAAHKLAAIVGHPVTSPRKVSDLALRGAFPAQFTNGRWQMEEEDLPRVAAALGIELPVAEQVAA